MKPYPYDNLTPKEKHFNYMLSRARRVTENAFGQLKNRFRRIGNGLELMLENDSIVIRASCILHNILNEKNDYLNEEFDVASSEQLENREQPVHVTMRAPTAPGNKYVELPTRQNTPESSIELLLSPIPESSRKHDGAASVALPSGGPSNVSPLESPKSSTSNRIWGNGSRFIRIWGTLDGTELGISATGRT
uniref:Uncharacterized protein n=1 Tax=Phlebotomus papatasi TaxID=29031 RepID=A0A1B0D9H1_PHLPP